MYTLGKLISKNANLSRSLSLSSINGAKKVIVTNEKTATTVEGIPIETRKEQILDTKQVNSECCPLCSLDLKVKYTDVLILSQYLDEDNKIIPFRKSNLCGRKYYLMKILIDQAQNCNLLPKKKNHSKFGPWEDLNHYVDFPNRKRDQPMNIIKRYWE